MKSRFTTILIATLTLAVGLAGCTDGDTTIAPSTGDGTIDLGSNGAITGLVVDDNYRPVQLKEEWGAGGPGEFQDIGFVLILETGQRFETTENGEFNVVPLKPGKYTIRVAADNHEAKDTIVNVVSGEYTEITLEARRTFSAGGTILSQEEVLFIGCAFKANTPYGGYAGYSALPAGCTGDTSGDSERSYFFKDYRSKAPDIRGMVTELRTAQSGYYGFQIRVFDDACAHTTDGTCEYAFPQISNGRYAKTVLYPGLQLVQNGPEYLQEGEDGYCQIGVDECKRNAFTLDYEFQTLLSPDPPATYYEEQIGEIDPIVLNPTTTGSAGIIFGIKGQFLQTVYLYELPEDGIEDFCALCDDADIPE